MEAPIALVLLLYQSGFVKEERYQVDLYVPSSQLFSSPDAVPGGCEIWRASC